MSAGNGPSVATTGLVFYYDMSNTQKSWLGSPTTNLYYAVNNYLNGNGNHWINSGGATYNDNDTSETPPYIPYASALPASLRITSCKTTTVGNQQVGMGITSVSPSTTYTMSVWLKTTHKVWQASPYMRTNVNNNSIATFDYNGDTNFLNWPTNQWIRLTATGTTQSNENGIYLSSYIGDTVGHKILYYGFQIEQKSFATPLVAGTRSNTQAIVDLTGNSVITANSLTYTSDNTFRFDGSQHLSVPNSSYFNMTTALSIEAWVKFDGNSDDFIFEKGDVNTQYSLFSHGDDIVFRTYHSGDGGYHSQNPSKATVGVVNGQWTHIVGSWDGATKRIYINGVLRDAVSKSGSLVTTSKGASVGRFGGDTTGYYFNGLIGSVKVYNTGLSASEVKQNFSAARSRYGI
jgi:Concanavalin A-like lectin/glucanases superfamily